MIPDKMQSQHDLMTLKGGSVPFLYSDPLRLSNRSSLPFPVKAAALLSEQRGMRYDTFAFPTEEAECHLRKLASIMGLLRIDDDEPTAA